MNDHSKTINDLNLLSLFKDKENYIISNIQKTGFHPDVIKALKVKDCILNRLEPDYELWQIHKDNQKKWSEGGHLKSVEKLPFLEEDEPYLYAWRGPPGRNTLDMKTSSGMKIKHITNKAEEFLKPVYADKLICNCSYYATLHAILSMKADKITYFGIDFYNHLSLNKKWFIKSPRYLSKEWWELRLYYEGAHMKKLWEDYLSQNFPQVKFIFYTTDRTFITKKENIIINYV